MMMLFLPMTNSLREELLEPSAWLSGSWEIWKLELTGSDQHSRGLWCSGCPCQEKWLTPTWKATFLERWIRRTKELVRFLCLLHTRVFSCIILRLFLNPALWSQLITFYRRGQGGPDAQRFWLAQMGSEPGFKPMQLLLYPTAVNKTSFSYIVLNIGS